MENKSENIDDERINLMTEVINKLKNDIDECFNLSFLESNFDANTCLEEGDSHSFTEECALLKQQLEIFNQRKELENAQRLAQVCKMLTGQITIQEENTIIAKSKKPEPYVVNADDPNLSDKLWEFSKE